MSLHLVEVYTESTPNPEALKFVTDQHLLPNFSAEFKSANVCEDSALAKTLFEIPFIESVFISNNFITINKKGDYEWFEITPEIKAKIKQFLETGGKAVSEKLFNQGSETPTEQAIPEDAAGKIKYYLEKYVKPAVENDGGHIGFKSFENGVVSLSMQGSCSGCPSSQITLKSGIEGLLKRMVPEVNEVIAVEE